MKQMLLDLDLTQPASLDNFYIGPNVELMAYLKQILAQPSSTFTPTYIWGNNGSGKTHLLTAIYNTFAKGKAIYLDTSTRVEPQYDIDWDYIFFDDIEQFNVSQQQIAFAWFVQAQTDGIQIIASGRLPPQDLSIREDLRTRIGWGQIFHLAPLDDEHLIKFLKQQAQVRSMQLSNEVINYILLHLPRDMAFLTKLISRLDEFSLQHKRLISIPLLKQLIEQQDKI